MLSMQLKSLETEENEKTSQGPKKVGKLNKVVIVFAVIGLLLIVLWNELTTIDKRIVRCGLTGSNEITVVLQTHSPLVLLWSAHGRRDAFSNGFMGPYNFNMEETEFIETFEIWKLRKWDGRLNLELDLLQMKAKIMRDVGEETDYYFGECK